MLTALPEAAGAAAGHAPPERDSAARRAACCPYVIDTAEAARVRFPHVESHAVRGAQESETFAVTVALPLSYAKSKRRAYPLLLLSDGTDLLGSAIETARVLAATREARECIVVSHDDAWLAPADADAQAVRLARIVDWCRGRFRIARGEVALFAAGRGMASARQLLRAQPRTIDRWIVADDGNDPSDWLALASRRSALAWIGVGMPDGGAPHAKAIKLLPESTPQGLVVPALAHGIRRFWGTRHAYGDELMPLSRPLVSRAATLATPLIRALRAPAIPPTTNAASRHVLRSTILARDFEIFVSLPRRPPSADAGFPMVLALDANTTASCVFETAARMARAGEIEEVVIVSVGVPRAEGDIAFGLRRFEELSPDAGQAAFQTPLGRFFLGVFALFGLDARKHFGLAATFHRFLADELLPVLLRSLPVDASRLCLVGHSAAGTYAAFERAQPDTPFTRFAVLSPGVAISDGWMLKSDGGLRGNARHQQVLVAAGGEELNNAFNRLAGIPQSKDYADALRAGDATARVDYATLEDDTHTTVFSRALALALRHHFKQH